MRDPHALMVAERQAMGDLLPKVVSGDDVAKLKRDLDPAMVATDAAVRDCASLDAGNRIAWAAFFGTWLAYRAEPNAGVLGFGAANRFDQGIAFQSALAQWQVLLRGRCDVPGPPVEDPHKTDENNASVVKWAAAAVIAVAVVWGIRSVVR